MVLLIGYGNPLRRDDGVGPALARMLQEAGTRTDLRVVTPHQLTPELALELADPEITAVLFIDATAVVGARGPLPRDTEPRQLEPTPRGPSLGHYLPPDVLLAYADLLYGAHPRAWLITIPGHDFGFGEGFSCRTAALLSVARSNALELLERLD